MGSEGLRAPNVVAGAGAIVCGGALVLGGPRALLGLTAALLVGLWWAAGAREGRRLREAILAAVALAVASGFVSSWLGSVGGVPAGAVLRDAVFVVVLLAAADESRNGYPAGRLFAYAALAAVVVVSIDAAGGLPAFIGARTYLLYPLILLAPAWTMPVPERLALARGMVAILAVVAVVGLIEVATRGTFLDTLGYRSDFAETGRTSSSPYFAGFRRATGGLGNFLEFGLVMNIGLLLARASLRGPLRIAAMTLFSVAAVLSWSRLSWALCLVIAALPLGLIGDGRTRFQFRRLGGAVVVVLIALLALNYGPGTILKDRLSGSDRVTQRSNTTRENQLSLAVSQVGTKLIGSGPGTQGAAADRQAGGPARVVTDNGYLIWLLELGWLGFAAIAALSVLLAMALVASAAWWALALFAVLATSNALFAAADSRVVLVLGFIAIRVLWTSGREGDVAPAPPARQRPALPASARAMTFEPPAARAAEPAPTPAVVPVPAAGPLGPPDASGAAARSRRRRPGRIAVLLGVVRILTIIGRRRRS